MGLRVSEEEELMGLDLSQHKESAYVLTSDHDEGASALSRHGSATTKPATSQPKTIAWTNRCRASRSWRLRVTSRTNQTVCSKNAIMFAAQMTECGSEISVFTFESIN